MLPIVTTCLYLTVLNHCKEHKKAQLSLTNPRDAKACQKLLQFDVKTSCRQVNDLFEVMEFGFLKYRNLIIIQRVINNVDRVRLCAVCRPYIACPASQV